MNIVLITLGIYPVTTGGVEVHCFNQALKLAARGWKISVLTKKHARSPSRITVGDVVISILRSTPLIIGQLLFVVEATSNLMRGRRRINLVHVHYATYFMLPAYLFNLLTGKPFVVTCHGYDVIYFGSSRLWRFIQKLLLRRASAITTPSSALRKSLIAHYRLDGQKITVVPNGVDLDGIERTKAVKRLDNNRRVILVANLRPVKDPLTAVKAFEIAANRVENLQLVIVGDGSERQRIQSYIEDHGLSGIIQMRGSMSHPDALREIWLSDCLILSSISEGGIPLVVLEAMALGKPVVATAVGGVNDIIVNRSNGLLAPASSPEALGEEIVDVMSQGDLATAISRKARKDVEPYTWNRTVAMYEHIYSSLLSRNDRKGDA